MKPAAALLLAPILFGACAQTLVYEASSPEGHQRLKERRRSYGRPFIGSPQVDREARLLPRAPFAKIREGHRERVACWRIETQDGTVLSADEWQIEAVLAHHLVLLERGKPASRVIDAEDLERVEVSPISTS